MQWSIWMNIKHCQYCYYCWKKHTPSFNKHCHLYYVVFFSEDSHWTKKKITLADKDMVSDDEIFSFSSLRWPAGQHGSQATSLLFSIQSPTSLRQKLKVDTEMSVFLPSSWMWIKPVETSSYIRLPDCEAWVSRHFCVGGWVLAAKRTNHQDCSPTRSPFWNLPSPFAFSVIIFLQMVDSPFPPRKLSNIFC